MAKTLQIPIQNSTLAAPFPKLHRGSLYQQYSDLPPVSDDGLAHLGMDPQKE